MEHKMTIYDWLRLPVEHLLPPRPAMPWTPTLPLGLSPREATLFLTRGTLPPVPWAFAPEEGDCARCQGDGA